MLIYFASEYLNIYNKFKWCAFFIAGIDVPIRCHVNSCLMTLTKFKNAKYNVEV